MWLTSLVQFRVRRVFFAWPKIKYGVCFELLDFIINYLNFYFLNVLKFEPLIVKFNNPE